LVADTSVTPVRAVVPSVTVGVATKFVPVIVMVLVTLLEPEAGLTAVTVGPEAVTVTSAEPVIVPLLAITLAG
jgi:hypothetical protein